MGRETLFSRRMGRHYDELKWLYCELYEGGIGKFQELCERMEQRSRERDPKFKRLDRKGRRTRTGTSAAIWWV